MRTCLNCGYTSMKFISPGWFICPDCHLYVDVGKDDIIYRYSYDVGTDSRDIWVPGGTLLILGGTEITSPLEG